MDFCRTFKIAPSAIADEPADVVLRWMSYSEIEEQAATIRSRRPGPMH